MEQKSRDFLYAYLNNASPVGFEAAGQKIWLNYIKPFIHEYFVDTYGTTVGVVNPDAPYKVVIEAHADEISWFVNYISPEGYIYVIRNGGSDHQIAPSKRVVIHTDKGPVNAVFGWPAIHVRERAKEAPPTPENIILDCGCNSKEEVEKLGVHVGCVATYQEGLTELNNGQYFTGRALDNRIGGFIIAEVARKLHENGNKLPFCLYVVNAVQEEIGLRGAEMVAHRLNPDVAICTDVCHDTGSPLYKPKHQGEIKCGKGPALTYGPAVQNNVLKMLIATAENNGIPFQRRASSRSTGTDTDAFAYSGQGVASALVSTPLKYMHTTVETAHRDDVQNVVALIYQFLLQLPAGHDFRYFN